MIEELFLIGIRIYLTAGFILVLNAISRFAFSPSMTRIRSTVAAIVFTPFWPLGIFSADGRKVLFNKLEKL